MRASIAGAITAALLALAGCAQPELPRDHFYRLATALPAVLPAPLLDAPLEVARPRAEGVVGARALLFAEADAPGRLLQYDYHLWADPPAAMLQDALMSWLRAAAVAPAVAATEQRAGVGYRLASRLRLLEQVRGAPGEVRVSMTFSLLRSADRALLWSAQFEERVVTADNSVDAAVTAYGTAVTRIFERMLKSLSAGGV